MKKPVRIILLLLSTGLLTVSPLGVEIVHAGFWDQVLGLADNAIDSLGFLVASVIKWTIYATSSLALWLSGEILDFAAEYSLGISGNTNIYKSAFILEGWKIVRDVANMSFIFAMLYIAIVTILRATTTQTRQLLVWVIIIALLVNFSLFFTQVVVDASNILALEFYTEMVTTGENGKERTLSTIFMSGFNPQGFTGEDIFKSWVEEHNKSSGHLIFMYFAASAVQFYAAWLLFFAAFLFLGRIAMLWILMIISPIALIAYIFPKTRGKFQDWVHRLLSQAFLAPVFLFFFFLIAKFIFLMGKGKAFEIPEGSDDFFGEILRITIPFIFLAILLRTALNVTKKMSGEVAGAATTAAKFTAGAALTAATGGAALAARGTIGRAGAALKGSKRAKEAASQRGVRGFAGRLALRGARAAEKGSFDMRGTAAVKGLTKAAGIKLGKPRGKGGFEKLQKERVKRETEMGEMVGAQGKLRPEEQEKVAQLDRAIQIRQRALPLAQKRRERAQAAHDTRPTEENRRQLESAQNLEKLAKEGVQKVKEERRRKAEVQRAPAERAGRRRERFAETVEQRAGGVIARVTGRASANREAARKIRRGKTAEEKQQEKFKDILVNLTKEDEEVKKALAPEKEGGEEE